MEMGKKASELRVGLTLDKEDVYLLRNMLKQKADELRELSHRYQLNADACEPSEARMREYWGKALRENNIKLQNVVSIIRAISDAL